MVFFRPAFIYNFGFVSKFFLTHPQSLTNHEEQKALASYISNGTILTLNDLWSFQNGLYQTIISVLIGLNAALATLSFFIIKNSSNNAARDEAVKEVKRHIVSHKFNKRIRKKIFEKFSASEIDFTDIQSKNEILQQQLDDQKTLYAGVISKYEALLEKTSTIESQLGIITDEISRKDNEELNSGAGLELEER